MSSPFDNDPATHVAAVTPSDANDLPNVSRALYVGTGGDVVLIGANASPQATGVTFKNVPAGAILPVKARKVLATGTTASNIVALR